MRRLARKRTPRWVTKELRGPLNGWLNEANERTQLALRRHRAWGIDRAEKWFYDQDTGLLTFRFPDRTETCPFQFLGSYDGGAGTWMWAWANGSMTTTLKLDSMAVHESGHASGSRVLTEPVLPVSREDADCLALLAIRANRYDGLYKAPDGQHITYLSFGSPLP